MECRGRLQLLSCVLHSEGRWWSERCGWDERRMGLEGGGGWHVVPPGPLSRPVRVSLD